MNYYMSEPYPLDPSGFKDDNMLPADAQNVPPPGYLSATAAAAAATATRPPASANAPPRIAAAPAGYTYLGCYTEVLPGRTLNASTLIRPQTTVLGCAADCGEDSEYFGVEFGTQCFCGSSLAVGSVAVNEGCSTACAGNATEVCGGVNLLSVYRKQTQSS